MPTVHHIPVCPFSQRLEILLELKGCRDRVDFHVVDITRPRDPELLALTGGRTALPVLVADDGTVLRESLVILRYLDTQLPGPRVAAADALRHAVEELMVTHEGPFGAAGYRLVMNQDPAQREALLAALLEQYARLDEHLGRHRLGEPWLQPSFGWAEVVFTPLFVRFAFLDYYEGFELPPEPRFERVRAWRDACLAHPAARQVSAEEVVKLYADYAQGSGNGALPPGRQRSSFVFTPSWRGRPWPPRDKYAGVPGDAELGLL
jgi:glutathione S-transferase